MCAIVWILGLCSAIPHVPYDSLGRVPGVLCAIRFDKDTLIVTLVSNYILVLSSLALVGFFNFKIFRFVHQHQKQKLSQTQRTNLQKDGEMAKFILVSAIVPLALQTPATIGLFVRMWSREMVSAWILFGVTAIFMTCPVLNPIITVMMIRPIRRELIRRYRHVLGRDGIVSLVNSPQSVTRGAQGDMLVTRHY